MIAHRRCNVRTAIPRWTLTTLTLLLTPAWLLSRYWVLALVLSGSRAISIDGGCLIIEKHPTLAHVPPGPTVYDNIWRQFSTWRASWYHDPQLAQWMLILPLWIPILLTATPAAASWSHHLARNRRLPLTRADLCPTCTYSRRGLPPSSPCPECGSASPEQP